MVLDPKENEDPQVAVDFPVLMDPLDQKVNLEIPALLVMLVRKEEKEILDHQVFQAVKA